LNSIWTVQHYRMPICSQKKGEAQIMLKGGFKGGFYASLQKIDFHQKNPEW
jgi:hypothetical protein